jgi:dipeptidase E
MRLLLFSNSTNAGEEYLEYPMPFIKEFLGEEKLKAIFIPYAGVALSYDDYEKKVSTEFNKIGFDLTSIHHFQDPVEAIKNSQVIVVGGGNTFHLTAMLQAKGLIEAIRTRVLDGAPYIGWSAGSNITCPTICTTNDMPIIQPESFKALNLVRFQINPHYLDANPDGHAGETREMRINEFLEINKDVYVVGLREGTLLMIDDDNLKFRGNVMMRVFRYGTPPREYSPEDDLEFLR